MSGKGYIVAEVKSDHPEAMAAYREASSAAVRQHGGRFLVRGGSVEVMEGPWAPPQRLVIIEFDSVEQARRFVQSPEYQAAKALRAGLAEMNMLLVAGIDNPV